MIRHPARHYILYLFSKLRYDANQVAAKVIEKGLPYPRDDEEFSGWITHLKKENAALKFPPRYRPHDKRHQSTVSWLRQQRINDIWRNDPAVDNAFTILNEPPIRRALEIMLLGPLHHAAIARRLATTFDLPVQAMNTKVVKLYGHYFWNYEAMTVQEWEHCLNHWVIGDTTDYLVALKSPRAPLGAAMALTLADQGAGNDTVRESLMYRYARDISFTEFMRVAVHMKMGDFKASAMSRLLANMIAAQEQLDMRRGASAELIEELQRLEATYDESRLTTVHDLPLDKRLPADGIEDAEFEDVKDD